MANATDAQVQAYVDQRTRPRCQQIRNLYLDCKDDIATIGDVFAALTQPSPTWTDQRLDGPPHLLAPSDVLAWNTVITGIVALIERTFPDVTTANSYGGQYPIVQKACVVPPV